MMRVQNRFDSKKVGELVCDGAFKYVQNFAVEIDGDRVAEYKSLDKVASDWKDYVPKEPLIKDEKIRKPNLIDLTNDDELMDRVLRKSAEMQDELLKQAEEEEEE